MPHREVAGFACGDLCTGCVPKLLTGAAGDGGLTAAADGAGDTLGRASLIE